MGKQAEPVQYLAEGTSKSGLLVQCTPRFGTNCSETNSLRILGQGLGDLLIGESVDCSDCVLLIVMFVST